MIRVNEISIDHRPGMTIEQALEAAGISFPHLVVSLDGNVVPNDDFDVTEIKDGAEVQVMLIAHGG